MHGVFGEISLIIVLAGILGILVHMLKQPAILAYILTGLIVGPLGYLQLNNAEILNSLSGIGITLLLFMVGLELSLKDIKQMGWVVVVVGITQIAVMALLGSLIFTMFGLSAQAAVYLGLGVGISSTIIAVKIISEKRDQDSLYGKLVLGILIVEDLVSILALAVISGFSGGQAASFATIALVLLKLAVLLAIAIFASRHFFPWVAERLAKSGDLIFLFSLAWGLGFATIISENLFGLTPEIGGFLAGLTLANSHQNLQIASRMKPLRDFFLILFFIILGSKLIIEDLATMLLAALGIMLLGVIVKPVFTFVMLTFFGYKGRTSFMTASSLAHISEFSIILAVLGWRAGHLNESALSLMTLATILSFVAASYLLAHNQTLAQNFRAFLAWWDPKEGSREILSKERSLRGHIVLVGAHRTGQSILHSLEELHRKFVVVDFNPSIVRKFKERGIYTLFGDISDPEIQEKAHMERARVIISTVPDFQDNLAILEAAKMYKAKAKLIVYGNNDLEAEKLYDKGADYVLMPHFLGGLQLAELLKKDINLKNIKSLRQRDLELIQQTT